MWKLLFLNIFLFLVVRADLVRVRIARGRRSQRGAGREHPREPRQPVLFAALAAYR